MLGVKIDRGLSLSPLKKFAEKLGAATPEEGMRSACRQLLSQGGYTTPPIHLPNIGKQLGLRKIHSLIHYRGIPSLMRSNGGYEIIYRPNNRRRDRFTIAHEIAHMIIIETLSEKKLIQQLYHPSYLPELERLCNAGASELLIPETMFWESLKTYGINRIGLRHLYDDYLISQQVLLIRLTELIPFSAVVTWKYYAHNDRNSIDLRVIDTWGQFREKKLFGLYAGCSTKYLEPNIVLDSYSQKKPMVVNNLILKHSKPYMCTGVSDRYFIDAEPDTKRQLAFEGFHVEDEKPVAEVFLFLIDTNLAAYTQVWKQIKVFLNNTP